MSHSDDHENHFSVLIFVSTIIASVGVYLGILALFFPAVWEIQFKASITSFILTFVVCHFFLAIFEHLFHRYVLHTPLIPGLSRFYKSHTKHHALTRVILKKTGVENYYPIIEEKQHENSFFPWYSYLVFALILTPIFVLVHLWMPIVPIFLAGALALAWSLSLYELLHATEHYPLEKWIPKLEHSNQYIRTFWRIAYGFHLRHHANDKCNEGISGFFGIPVADFIFGTWINPKTLYVHGKELNKEEFMPPRPFFLIRWIDEFAAKQIQKRRNKSRF
jgi:hemolysin III